MPTEGLIRYSHMKKPLYEHRLQTDRWSARAISPVDIRKSINADRDGEVVIVHPGWAKSPERYAKLLFRLADRGYFSVGVDTRYAYADQGQPRKSFITQPRRVGTTNPYFTVESAAENRWELRRPTVLLDICDRLGVGMRSYIGHSEGGRVCAFATVTQPDIVKNLIIVNGAGTGDSSNGTRRMMRSNLANMLEMLENTSDLPAATLSALGSAAYALTHLRRTISEKQIIQTADTWSTLDNLANTPVRVSVFHAIDDELISFDDSSIRAAARPWIDFRATVGGHGNIHDEAVQSTILDVIV